jgi:hypothetical protein
MSQGKSDANAEKVDLLEDLLANKVDIEDLVKDTPSDDRSESRSDVTLVDALNIRIRADTALSEFVKEKGSLANLTKEEVKEWKRLRKGLRNRNVVVEASIRSFEIGL